MEIIGLISTLGAAVFLAFLVLKAKQDSFSAGVESVSNSVNKESANALERIQKAGSENLDTSRDLGAGRF